ncbi:MAG: hypothetical protein HY646_15935 [Acidobacteria bacterium]|nr:hypothetical protein [Acidobacteriota bacterium]
MATFIYFMCAATSLACAVLLLRAYQTNKLGLLFWSGVCFAGLALSNTLLVIDLVFVPDLDLSLLRHLVTLTSVSVLIYSLVWETQ